MEKVGVIVGNGKLPYSIMKEIEKDKEEAYLFITRGQKVPEELERKLIQREQDRIAREKQKQKENKA